MQELKAHNQTACVAISGIIQRPSSSVSVNEKRKVVNRLFNKFARHEGLQFIRTWRPFLNEDKTPNVELFAKDGLHLSAKCTARFFFKSGGSYDPFG